MMTQPTSARLLEVVRQELADHIGPAITDPQLAGSLAMVQHILTTLETRTAHEIGWMVEEIEEVEAVAAGIIGELPNAPVAEALAQLRAAPPASLHLDAVTERYVLGSEVLSRLLEAVPADHPRRGDVEALLDTRLAHETAIMGEFSLVGRG